MGRELSVPSIKDPSDPSKLIYEVQYYPFKKVVPRAFNRNEGLGHFALLRLYKLKEFIDDYLKDPKDLCALACTSRTFSIYVSDDKRWRRIARRLFKGNLDFVDNWQRSVVLWHNYKTKKDQNEEYQRPKLTPLVHDVPPFWPGLEAETMRAFKMWYRASSNPKYFELSCPDHIDRIDVSKVSVQEFIERYELPGKPCLIAGLTKSWAAAYNWTKETLVKRHGDAMFRTGGGFKMKLRRFFEYLERQHEQQPLYLFDQHYPENAVPIEQEYAIPEWFQEDLFKITGEEDRPPYRWILIGPSGSGVPFHTDPRGTSAWNTVLFGLKRWAMYPPGVQPPGVGPDNSDYYDAPIATKWYTDVYPTISDPELKPLECLHYPGETIFIPSGWWHLVYNCGDINTAVTHNFASSQNFHRVVRDMIHDDGDEFAKIFKKNIKAQRPQLYQRWKEMEEQENKYVDSDVESSSSESTSDSE